MERGSSQQTHTPFGSEDSAWSGSSRIQSHNILVSLVFFVWGQINRANLANFCPYNPPENAPAEFIIPRDKKEKAKK